MRERTIPGSKFGKTLYFTDREINRMCVDALKESRCLPSNPEPIDIEFFVEKHFDTDLDFGTDLGDEILGWTYFGRRGEIRIVGVSQSLSCDETVVGQRRCRATVAHEAGHCLMHPILFMEDQSRPMFENLDFAKNQILCRKDDFRGKYDGRWWEVQANKAIGGFLLPCNLVRDSVQEFLVTEGSMGLESLPAENRQSAIAHVADTFDVNKKPAEIKLDKLYPETEGELL